MRLLLSFVMSSLVGCTLTLTDSPVECADLLDCPQGEVCRDGLCQIPSSDVSQVADTGVDAEVTDEPDLGPRTAPYPAGVCFEQMTGKVPDSEALGHIPRGYCSDWALVWSEAGELYDTLVVQGGNSPDDDLRIEGVVGPAHVTARAIYVTRINPVEDAANVWKQNLVTGAGEFIKPSSRRQASPSRGTDFAVLTEQDATGLDRVLIRFDDGIVHDCGRQGHAQRAPVAGPDWVAWIESRPGSRVDRIVVTDVAQCRSPENHRIRLLLGRVPLEHALKRAGDTLVWLVQTADQGTRLRRWDHRQQGQEPQWVSLSTDSGTPNELTAHGDRVAVVFYRNRSPRFTLEVLDLRAARRHPIATTGNVHHPTLTDRYILWSQGSGSTGWEVRYDTLD